MAMSALLPVFISLLGICAAYTSSRYWYTGTTTSPPTRPWWESTTDDWYRTTAPWWYDTTHPYWYDTTYHYYHYYEPGSGYGYLCPDGWTVYHGHCYLYIAHDYTWSAASATCATLNAELVEPSSESANAFIADMYQAHGAKYGWIGLQDFAIEDEFVWASNLQRPSYSNWQAGQPDNANDQDCVEMEAETGEWNDQRCEHTTRDHAFICQRRGYPVVIG